MDVEAVRRAKIVVPVDAGGNTTLAMARKFAH